MAENLVLFASQITFRDVCEILFEALTSKVPVWALLTAGAFIVLVVAAALVMRRR